MSIFEFTWKCVLLVFILAAIVYEAILIHKTLKENREWDKRWRK